MGYYTAATGRLGSRSTLDSGTYTPAASVSVRLVVAGTDIDAYLDASHKIDTADSTHAAGGVAFAGQQPKFDNLAIGYDENADGDLNDANDTKPVAETFASTSTSFTYDQAGNLVDDGSFRYTYDAWNRLVKATSATDTDVTFHVREYYGDGRWSKKTVTNAGQYKGAVVPYYDGWEPIELRDGSGNMRQQFVRGTQYVDELVMMRRADHGDLYVHQDANWNVIALTDLGGSVVERYRYTPYGQMTVDAETSYGDADGNGVVNSSDRDLISDACAGAAPTGSCRVLDLDFDNDVDASDTTLFDALTQGAAKHPNLTASAVDFAFGLHGSYLDAELGQYQCRFRHFAPQLGGYLQRDPLGYIDSLSLYEAFAQNPLMYRDPSGACLGGIGNLIGGIVGGIVGGFIETVKIGVQQLPIALIEGVIGSLNGTGFINGIQYWGHYCGDGNTCTGWKYPREPVGNGNYKCYVGPPGVDVWPSDECPNPVGGPNRLDECCRQHDQCQNNGGQPGGTWFECDANGDPTDLKFWAPRGEGQQCAAELCACMDSISLGQGPESNQREQMRFFFLCPMQPSW